MNQERSAQRRDVDEMTAAMRVVRDAADALAASGVGPSLRRIADRIGRATSAVEVQVHKLRAAGQWPYDVSKGGRPSAPKVEAFPPPAPNPLRERARRIAILKKLVALKHQEKRLKTKFAPSLEAWQAMTGHLIHGPDFRLRDDDSKRGK